ncbi:MAG: ATP phosphoribosyltransferase regulatory subunit [bacterium]|nr:ATP phosphoribosyltransferase regulatory subunit [bacterium]
MVAGDMDFNRAMPAGAKVFLPEQAERKRQVEQRLLDTFGRWGFREIVTSAFDFCGPETGGEVREEQTFRLVDRESGGLLALRSDVTPQIARIAGTLLAKEPRPLRLCYVTDVFRHAHVAGLLQREYRQAGVELIGLMSLEADVEMIAIASTCFRVNGVENFRMSLSHGAFLKGLLEEFQLEGSQRTEVLEAVARRDVAGLRSLTKEVRSRNGSAKVLLALPELFGGGEVLRRAEKLVANRDSRRALAELRQVSEMLELYGIAEQVIFDLSDFRNFNYYTGVIFEGFVEGAGYPVCGGGRYDQLLGRYGTDGLGTGFAMDVDHLLRVASQNGIRNGAPDFLVIDFTNAKRIGMTAARELRACGWHVARDIMRRDLPASLAYARKAGIGCCLVVDATGGRSGQVRLMDSSGKERGRYSIAELVSEVGTRGDVP